MPRGNPSSQYVPSSGVRPRSFWSECTRNVNGPHTGPVTEVVERLGAGHVLLSSLWCPFSVSLATCVPGIGVYLGPYTRRRRHHRPTDNKDY